MSTFDISSSLSLNIRPNRVAGSRLCNNMARSTTFIICMVLMLSVSMTVQLASASRPVAMGVEVADAAEAGGRRSLLNEDDYDYDYDYDEDEDEADAEVRTVSADGWEYLLGIGCSDKPETKLDVTLKECHEACEDDSDCKAYSYNTRKGRCYLKEGPCDENNQKEKHDNISARKP